MEVEELPDEGLNQMFPTDHHDTLQTHVVHGGEQIYPEPVPLAQAQAFCLSKVTFHVPIARVLSEDWVAATHGHNCYRNLIIPDPHESPCGW